MIPVAIVTGFLGSGKTTLIASSDETLLALTTGCLCCAVRGDLAATLIDLQRRRAAGAIGYDRVLIETSGLADPAPILHALMTDRDIVQHHAIDGIVTVVDALHGEAALDRHAEARRQVALADTLLLSKTDLAAPTERLRTLLAGFNRDAMLQSARDVVPATLFTGTDIATRFAALPDPPARNPFVRAQHTDGIETFVLQRDRPMPALALTLLLEALAEHCGARLLRLKGLVSIEEMPGQPAVIHGVQHVFSPPQFLDRWPPANHTTRMVFITQGVPRHFPARLLDAIEHEVREAMEQPASLR